MTIRKRLAHSNIAMLVIPLLTAAVLALLGAAVVLVLLQTVWARGTGCERTMTRPEPFYI